jgi:hypothetical protein
MMHVYVHMLVILYEGQENQASIVIMFIPLPFLSLNCSNRNWTLETAPVGQTNTAYMCTKCTVQPSPQSVGGNTWMRLVMTDFVSGDQYMVPNCNAVLFYMFILTSSINLH